MGIKEDQNTETIKITITEKDICVEKTTEPAQIMYDGFNAGKGTNHQLLLYCKCRVKKVRCITHTGLVSGCLFSCRRQMPLAGV